MVVAYQGPVTRCGHEYAAVLGGKVFSRTGYFQVLNTDIGSRDHDYMLRAIADDDTGGRRFRGETNSAIDSDRSLVTPRGQNQGIACPCSVNSLL
jgi:hypothetical protein